MVPKPRPTRPSLYPSHRTVSRLSRVYYEAAANTLSRIRGPFPFHGFPINKPFRAIVAEKSRRYIIVTITTVVCEALRNISLRAAGVVPRKDGGLFTNIWWPYGLVLARRTKLGAEKLRSAVTRTRRAAVEFSGYPRRRFQNAFDPVGRRTENGRWYFRHIRLGPEEAFPEWIALFYV